MGTDDDVDRNPGVLFFYLQWADEMNARWRAQRTADALATMYMRTWLGALYALVEGWKRLELADLVVDRLLSMTTGRRFKPKKHPERDETFVDLLYGARNDVFHFSWKHHPAKIAAFLDTPGALAWANNLHGSFGVFFDKRARELEKDESES